jgi:hypothetical protein
MSIPFSSEQLACVRDDDDARRMAARAADHEHELDAFVQTAETDVCHAEAALSHAARRIRGQCGRVAATVCGPREASYREYGGSASRVYQRA